MAFSEKRIIARVVLAAGLALPLLAAACSGGGSERATPGPSATPAAATALPPNADEARRVFLQFVDAVMAGDVDEAWRLYAASLPGGTSEHRADAGCDFLVFGIEFSGMKHLFARVTPFEFVDTFDVSPGSTTVEFRLRTSEGNEMLATLMRVPADQPYRVLFLNSGQVTAVPGVPDPFPSPEDPQGYCGIWTGAR